MHLNIYLSVPELNYKSWAQRYGIIESEEIPHWVIYLIIWIHKELSPYYFRMLLAQYTIFRLCDLWYDISFFFW